MGETLRYSTEYLLRINPNVITHQESRLIIQQYILLEQQKKNARKEISDAIQRILDYVNTTDSIEKLNSLKVNVTAIPLELVDNTLDDKKK